MCWLTRRRHLVATNSRRVVAALPKNALGKFDKPALRAGLAADGR